jgi:hypothetical protein
MMSTVGARVEMGARYHGGACLGSRVGRQAPPVCLGCAKRYARFKKARLLHLLTTGYDAVDGSSTGTQVP